MGAVLKSFLGWISLPFYCLLLLIWAVLSPRQFLIDYFKPDIETAIVKRYKRPVIGLKLCGPCKKLKYRVIPIRINHHANEAALKQSAEQGCDCCQLVLQEFETA